MHGAVLVTLQAGPEGHTWKLAPRGPPPLPLVYVDSEKAHLLLLGSGQTHDPTALRHALGAFFSCFG